MASLHCCLAGFEAADVMEVESLAGLARRHVSADWSFSTTDGTAGPGACDLLLCDLGSAPGAAAWRDGAQQGWVRAAATNGDRVFGGLVLVRPFRLHGPDGLVHVLNEAARVVMNPAGPGKAPPGPAADGPAQAAPVKTGRLRSFLRTIAAWFFRSPAPTAALRPTAPPPPQAPEVPASARFAEYATEPELRAYNILPPDAPAPSRAADHGLAVATLARAGVAELHQSDRRPARRASSAAAGKVVTLDAMGCDLLDLLRRARAASQVVVVRLGGLPAICAAPDIETAYTYATLQAVFDCPAAALVPSHVTVARNSYHGRMEVQPSQHTRFVSVPSFPLKHLFWVATLRCGGPDEIAGYRDGAFNLLSWPDFSNLPHARHHLTWCGLLARRSMTAAALSKATAHGVDEAALFLAACDELGILKRKELPSSLLPGPSGFASRASGRATVSRAVLNRLGVKRP